MINQDEYYQLKRTDGKEKWQIISSDSKSLVSHSKTFTDEPEFQKFILNNEMPLKIQGRVYTPLCAEATYGDGDIDLVYIAEGGYLLLAELKNQFPKSPSTATIKIANSETMYRPIDHNMSFFIKLRNYITPRRGTKSKIQPWKIPVWALEKFEKWFSNSDLHNEITLKEMLEQGKLLIALIATGVPVEDLAPTPRFVVCSINIEGDHKVSDKDNISSALVLIRNNFSDADWIWQTWNNGYNYHKNRNAELTNKRKKREQK